MAAADQQAAPQAGSTVATGGVAGVVCDLDGTLIDTEPIYFESYKYAALELGAEEYPFEVHKPIMGRPEVEGAQEIVDSLRLGVSAEAFLAKRDELLIRLMPHCRPTKGAMRLARYFRRTGLPAAVATSSSREYLELKRRGNRELLGQFACCICGDDEAVRGRGKPRPDIFLAAARGIDCDPAACMAFEDAVAGVQAAAAAGMQVFSVPDARLPKASFEAASTVLGSLADFDPCSLGLPAFVEADGGVDDGVGAPPTAESLRRQREDAAVGQGHE